MGFPAGKLIVAVRIEGYGNPDGRFYFSTGVPASTIGGAQARWKPVLWHDPNSGSDQHGLGEFSESGNFQTAHTTLPDWECRLTAFDDIYTIFHSHIAPVAIDILGASFIKGSTTVVFANGTPATVFEGDLIYVARETIELGPEGPAGTFTGCLRGQLGTRDVTHKDFFVDGLDDRIFRIQPAAKQRLLELGYLTQTQWQDPALDLDTEFNVEFSFMTTDIASLDGGATITIQNSGFGFVLADAQLYPDPWYGVVDSVSSHEFSDGTILPIIGVVQKVPRGSTSSFLPFAMSDNNTFAWVRYNDSACVIQRSSGTDLIRRYVLRIEQPLRFMRSIALDEVKVGDIVWEIISSVPWSPSQVGAFPIQGTFSDLPLGRSRDAQYGDVITILLNLVTSTNTKENGKYDLGKSMGIEMPIGFLNIPEMEALRGSIGARIQYTHLYVGTSEEPVNAKQWIEETLLAPFRMIFARGSDGRWTLKYLDDLPPITVTVPQVGNSKFYTGVSISYSTALSQFRDKVKLQYQGDATGKATNLTTINTTVQQFQLSGGAGTLSVKAHGIESSTQADIINQTQQNSWRKTRPPFEFSSLLEDALTIGDPISVTTMQLPSVNEAGEPIRGTVDSISYVTGVATHLEGPDARADHKALNWGLGLGRVGYIGFALEVVSGFVYGGGGVLEFTANRYQSPISEGFLFDKDVEPFDKFWTLKHMDEFGNDITNDIEVVDVDVGANEITFVAPGSWGATPPVAGDIFHSSNYAAITESDQLRHLHQAKAGGTLGPGDDPGFRWII